MSAQADPPKLLPGRPALFWVRVAAVCVFAGFGLFVLMVLGTLLPAPSRPFEMFATLLLILLLSAVWLIASIAEGRASLRERAAGYTTVFKKYVELWQLDPKTGAVIRRPGETK